MSPFSMETTQVAKKAEIISTLTFHFHPLLFLSMSCPLSVSVLNQVCLFGYQTMRLFGGGIFSGHKSGGGKKASNSSQG